VAIISRYSKKDGETRRRLVLDFREIKITLIEEWHDDQSEMFSEGVGIQILIKPTDSYFPTFNKTWKDLGVLR